MPDWTCKQCGGTFFKWRNAYAGDPKYCSVACRRLNPTGHTKGHVPWNKGTRGVMKVNSGSFQKGHKHNCECTIGAKRVRKDINGAPRQWIKVSDDKHSSYDWRQNSVVVWEAANGPAPKGFVIHHKDRNTLNDDLENLELQSRADHLLEHKYEFEPRRKAALSRKRNPESSATVL